MKKSNGKIKYNIAVFISGRGSNLKSIVRYSLKNKTSRINSKITKTAILSLTAVTNLFINRAESIHAQCEVSRIIKS